ncbi:MAG: cupin domain-containing protein [Polyangiaceae bacterium]
MKSIRTNAEPSVLANMLRPMSEAAFMKQKWAREACVAHGPLSRLDTLAGLPELASVEALLDHVAAANKHTSVRAWFQDATGRHESIGIEPQDAKRLYRGGGVTIVVDGLNLVSPRIDTFLDSMGAALGTPAIACCNVYASPPGARTVMHFDPQESFLLQVQGRKRWRYAANTTFRFPTEASNFYAHVPGHEVIARTFPKEMPKTARKVTLSPGSVLYLPRGTWHEAQAVTHSLGVTLTFASKTWGDVLLDELRERIMKEEAWRMPATGVLGSEYQRALADEVLDERLRALRSEVLAMCGEGE